jgi:peroxiredoxin Q/BCP
MAIHIGEKAPAFSLPGSDGKTHSLADYAGQTVIVYFYPRDNTPGCSKEACSFRDLHPQLQQRNVVVLGVSADSLASHDKFIEKFSLPFVLLSDHDKQMLQSYGAWGEKTRCGKTSMGIIRSTVLIGPDGVVLEHWPKVAKAETHPAEVLNRLLK